MFKKGSLNTTEIIMNVPVTDGLYTITFPIKEYAQPRCHVVRKVDVYYPRWHDKLWYVSSEQFQQISTIIQDIPTFSSSMTIKIQCELCLVSKMKQFPVEIIDLLKNISPTEFHFDLSGPIKPSLWLHIHAAHFIKPTFSITDVRLFKSRSETSKEGNTYISKFHSIWKHLGHRVTRIRCDNAR